MEDKFLRYIQEHSLFSNKNKLLVAVSAGIDSISLIHLLNTYSFMFDIAHCNFGLRGEASDKDENFVKQLAKKYGVKFYSKKVNTKEEAKKRKSSIQMTARDLRYNWLEKKRKSIKADFILTAHHRDDDIETFFLNLIRGTGIKGLLGIPRINNTVIRPLLFVTKKNIITYVNSHRLQFREDSSNSSTEYLRNRIRHNLMPIIGSINPNFAHTFINEKKVFEGVYKIYQNDVDRVKQKLISKNKTDIQISIKALKNLTPLEPYLYELFSPFGFTNCKELASSLFGKSGKQFYSNTYRILIDREFLIITPKLVIKKKSYKIYEDCKNIKEPISLEFRVTDEVKINKNDNSANLDFEQLKFPLTLRAWEKGDRFVPLGMKKHKKLSDFFIDNKLSIIQKESTWILCSDNQIIWVAGIRIDNRYKITEDTKKMYIATLST